MKKTNYKAVLIIALSLVLFSGISAQSKTSYPEKSVKNLVTAIESDNDGLKRSGIYWAGFYKVNETAPVLLELFPKENSKNQILIALSLYQMGEENHIMKLLELSNSESNSEVKRMCNAVVEQYQKNAIFTSR
ncbi:MAG: HEAT repeat domain-containing protein [Ignavibacteriaceae bacterium]|jgi:hypothetical protein